MISDLYMVELRVADWAAAVAWYRDCLGLAVLLRVEEDQFALLQAGGIRLSLKAGEPDPGSMTLMFEVTNLIEATGHLMAKGIVLDGPIETRPEGYRRVYLHDLDGYRLCLFDWGEMPASSS